MWLIQRPCQQLLSSTGWNADLRFFILLDHNYFPNCLRTFRPCCFSFNLYFVYGFLRWLTVVSLFSCIITLRLFKVKVSLFYLSFSIFRLEIFFFHHKNVIRLSNLINEIKKYIDDIYAFDHFITGLP